jgi:hypothetical protein
MAVVLKKSLGAGEKPPRKEKQHGGSAWESNPPAKLFTRHTGFEVREGHQCPFHFPSDCSSALWPKEKPYTAIFIIAIDLKNNFLL